MRTCASGPPCASSYQRWLLGVVVATGALLGNCSSEEGRLPRDEMVRACVRASACSVRAYPRVSNCIEGYDLKRAFGLGGTYNAIFRCINGASSCAEMRACFGITSSERCDSDYQASCDGSTAVSCDLIDHQVYRLDCAASGMGCGVKKGSSFEASCSPGSCDPASFANRCDGSRLRSCNDGVIAIEDCAAQGLACSETAGQPDCIGSGGDCASEATLPRCDGNVAVSCVGGRVQRLDCGNEPLKTRCDRGACRVAGNECADEFDRCAGEGLQTCLDGRWTTVNCADLGLGGCVPGQNGASCAAP